MGSQAAALNILLCHEAHHRHRRRRHRHHVLCATTCYRRASLAA